jgi:hypothetical protein
MVKSIDPRNFRNGRGSTQAATSLGYSVERNDDFVAHPEIIGG